MSRPARGWAYAAIGFLFVAVMMATTEPTPLYVFWERSYGFGAIVTTLVFATYAIGVIAALLWSRVVPSAVNLLGLGTGPIVAGALAETAPARPGCRSRCTSAY